MLISYYANKKSSPRLPSWQPSLIFFNIPIESGSIIKPCTLKHFQVTYRLHKAGYWTIAICEFKMELQSGKAQVGSKLAILCPVWPRNLTDDLEKTVGHLFYAISSFVHHLIAINGFKMELLPGIAKFGSKSAVFCSVWPWPLTSDLDLLYGHHVGQW